MIAEKAVLEGSTWSMKYPLLIEPQKDGMIRLIAVTMHGVPIYVGSARIKTIARPSCGARLPTLHLEFPP